MTLSITERRVLKHIEEFPEISQPELVAALKIRATTMYYALRTLRAAGEIRVSGWRRNQPAGGMTPEYSVADGKRDAPQPPPLPKSDIDRRYRQKHAAKISAREKARRGTLNPWKQVLG